MKMIVGLGNPGNEYDRTPHNVGFKVLDILAEEAGEVFKKKIKNGYVIKTQIDEEEVILVKPLTFMNNSGDCVFALSKKFNVKTKDICVILDDVKLSNSLEEIGYGAFEDCKNLTSIILPDSIGSHNGLRSVTTRLGTTDFYRIRIGVDSPDREGDLAQFVLKKMSPDLEKNVQVGIDNAVKYVKLFIKGEVEADTK